MRAITPALFNFLQGSTITVAYCVKLVRRDGLILGFTTCSQRLTIGGIYYDAINSIQSQNLMQSSQNDIDNLDITGILSSDKITDFDLRAGKYDGARLSMFLVNWADLTMGGMTLMTGQIGAIHIKEGYYVAELRGLSQTLMQQIGDVTSPTCRCKVLGDWQCKLNLAPYTVTATLSQVLSQALLTPAAPVQVYAIDAGGPGTGAFHSDENSSGGTTLNPYPGAVDTSALPNAAPQEVYQSERHGVGSNSFSYNLNGLTPNAPYLLRLHFAETKWWAAGQRIFAVYAQGFPILLGFDIWKAAGGNDIACIQEFNVVADGTGNVNVTFAYQGTDLPKVNGLELWTYAGGGAIGYYPALIFNGQNQASGYFNNGRVTFTSGLNAGITREVKTHTNSGGNAQLIMQEGFPFTVKPGDAASLVAGCDRRFETCDSKFHNTINFHGEPYLPGTSKIMQTGRPPS